MKDVKTVEIHISTTRKIVKNLIGYEIAKGVTSVYVFFIVLALIYLVKFVPESGISQLDSKNEIVCWCIGLVPKIIEGYGRDFLYPIFACYFAACLLQLYLPFRAMIQPSFLAGKPSSTVRNYFCYNPILLFY